MNVYGLLGDPVGHSRSPPMHEAAYDELDMDARYVTFEPDAIAPAIEGAKALGICGLNVTIPFKEDVLAHVEPDSLAERIGAVNTIDFSTSPPTGHNTDAAGARRAFERHDVSLDGKSAVLVGAGGAARAIAFMLADEGSTVAIANRTIARAASLADAVNGVDGEETATTHGLDELPELVADADVLVNATSVGMDSDETPVPADALHADLAVMDAVYSPLETRLLREASARGATTIDGAWMLLFQGVVAFELWTGRDAPVERMDAALRRRL
ncbi:shikimate dehydrogenase [Haladaptatus sp. R4]|uniref:shikimate dehydrogenase n=1 Tax=Haladaptatus sp. R4 TaxID=1679489 RepID=UPI0007B47ED2|nr:shikimate dehydrogenase [Haladaptatus sp. R4]KZN24243.1 shikimate dehydrogenase [Haladaptatus sp. R4]